MVNELTSSKVWVTNTLQDLFPDKKQYIDNVGNFLADNFAKIDGFDYRWSSLITSKPLLFEDMDYVRVRSFIKQECTKEEIEAYKSGKLRELYSTFENMIICNLEYYDRIMCFCTMVFLKYVRLSESETTTEHLNDIPYIFEMTPTQIWCSALTSTTSTDWELNYAWNYSRKNVIKILPREDQSYLEANYGLLYKNKIFKKFVEYCAYRNQTKGFKQTLLSDKTNNKKLSHVCSKFTKTSTAIDESQLESLSTYVFEINEKRDRLFTSLNACLSKEKQISQNFGIWIFSNEFFIFTQKFKMKITKDENNKISKQYIANSHECFLAELYMHDSIRHQIEWAKYQIPSEFNYDKDILVSILTNMLNENYHHIKCIIKMPEYGMFSEVTFKGCFANVRATEKLYYNNTEVHEYRKVLSKENMARYLVNRGYYIFGTIDDVDILFTKEITSKTLINHYSNYCIPVMQHMNDIIMLHLKSKNEIIDAMITGDINPNKLNNNNIKYTEIKGNSINNRDIMHNIRKLTKNVDKQNNKKLSYFRAINSVD